MRLSLALATGLAMLPAGASAQRIADSHPSATAQPPPAAVPSAQRKQDASRAYGQLPISFVPNAGQLDDRVRYQAQGAGYSVGFTATGARMAFSRGGRGAALDLNFVGGSSAVAPVAQRLGPGRVNYFIGNDPARWRTNLLTYQEIIYKDVWPGINVAFRGSGGRLKYELLAQPGARPSEIRLAYAGAARLSLDPNGNLQIGTALGILTDERPVSYQVIGGKQVAVESRFVLGGAATYGFSVGAYNPGEPLIIDPGLVYSTYLGGSGVDSGTGIAVDTAGNAYVTGWTTSSNFPTTPLAYDTSANGGQDVFVTKLNPAGTSLVYSTYLGGSSDDQGLSIALDTTGAAYLTGSTLSSNFPTKATLPPPSEASDTQYNGALDAFIAKLNPAGGLAYSTYLGGNNDDAGTGIAVDNDGRAYVTGYTESTQATFPFTPAALDNTQNGSLDAFLVTVDPFGTGFGYSSFLGGSNEDRGQAITLDGNGDAFLTGFTFSANFPTTAGAFDTSFNGGLGDAFVTRFNLVTRGLSGDVFVMTYSTFLGGGGDDRGFGIAIDSLGDAYVTGRTQGLPTTSGAFDTSQNGSFDAFVTKFNPAGTSPLLYSTYLGGSGNDQGLGIAVDTAGEAYVTGRTGSTNYPTTPGAFQTTNAGGDDVFLTKLNAAGSAPLIYSTYLGGNSTDRGQGVTLDATGVAYLTGFTNSSNFPTTPGAYDTTANGDSDAFVTKLLAVGAPATLLLTPSADSNPVGTPHTVTATVRDSALQPVAGVTVRFTVTGANPTSGSSPTNASGQATFTYTGTVAGLDTITAYADTNNNNNPDTGEPMGAATKLWTAGLPDTLVLTPPGATNPVGAQHCVTATVRDFFGNPVPNVTVVFSVPTSVATHATPAGGLRTTNSSGQAEFCYTAALPGPDVIHAFADTNHNGVQDVLAIPPEPSGEAAKVWTLPVTSGTCKITSSGTITAMNGDRAKFNGEVHVANGQASGHESYEDRGPLEPQQIDSTSPLTVVCPSGTGPATAMIYGHATVDGMGDFIFLIMVTDGGNGGKSDTYGITVSNGYLSGQQPLEGGNINIR